MYDEQNLYGKVREALRGFFSSDRDLLEKGANERSITHKLAEHLQCQFSYLKVDCEYNRHDSYTKTLHILKKAIGKKVYPDIVVHQRGNDERSLLVIEAKKSNNKSGMKEDRCKLREFTNPHGDYRYKFGLLLVFDVDKKQVCCVECFKNGEKHEKAVWDGLRGFPFDE